MGKHLVLVGGGHAHMITLANLHKFVEKDHKVTVIGPSEYHYYSGMGPGMLGGTYTPEDIRFATRRMVEKQGGEFIQGKVTRVDPEKQVIHLESGETVPYDVVSFNAGSYVPQTHVTTPGENIYTAKPIEKLMEARQRLTELLSEGNKTVCIIGGGPAGAEIAGNVWQLAKQNNAYMPKILIFAGNTFMQRFPEKIRQMAYDSLTRRGIKILENGYVQDISPGRIELQSGEVFDTDFIFLAVGVSPSLIFKDSGLPIGPDGGLRVNVYLQSVAYKNIFGGGDCIYFEQQPLDKVGVYAVRENPVLYHNLMASLDGGDLMPFDPGGDYLLIFNMGGNTGIFRKRGIVFGGRLAFMIKDYIDRRFMRQFQSFE